MKKILLIPICLSLASYLLAAPEENKTESKPNNTKNVLNPAASANPIFDPEAAQALAKQCDAIFEARKQEIASSLLQLQQQRSNLQILTTENTKLLKEREEQIKLKEQAVKQMYAEMKSEQAQKEQESQDRLTQAKALLERNEDILKQLNGLKENKLSESYAKMKEAKAAAIIAAMPDDDAISILLSLKPNQMGGILAQMQPDKAAELSKLIRIYPNKPDLPPDAPPPAKPEGINLDDTQSQDATQATQPSGFNTSGMRIY